MKDRLWANWKRLAHRLGRIQVLVILTLLYLVAFVPFGFFYRAGRLLSGKPRLSGWRPYRPMADPKDYFRRQG